MDINQLMKQKMSPFLLATLSCATSRKLVKIQQRLEKAEILYGKDLVHHAAKLAKETPYTIFYWIDQLSSKQDKTNPIFSIPSHPS